MIPRERLRRILVGTAWGAAIAFALYGIVG
jgi:hypothetical protein